MEDTLRVFVEQQRRTNWFVFPKPVGDHTDSDRMVLGQQAAGGLRNKTAQHRGVKERTTPTRRTPLTRS